jgi:hypothetical protein
MSTKVRQKHLVCFSELVTKCEKAKRHSVEKMVKKVSLGFLIFLCFLTEIFQGMEMGESR